MTQALCPGNYKRGGFSLPATPTPNNDHAQLLAQWEEYAPALRDPMMELTAEEFAPIAHTFDQLRRLGHPFDPVFVALMDLLIMQVVCGDEDGDADLTDDNSLEDGRFAHWRAA